MRIEITKKTQAQIDADVDSRFFDKRMIKRGGHIYLRYKRRGE